MGLLSVVRNVWRWARSVQDPEKLIDAKGIESPKQRNDEDKDREERIIALRRDKAVIKSGFSKWRYKLLASLDEEPSKRDVRLTVEKFMSMTDKAMDIMSVLSKNTVIQT